MMNKPRKKLEIITAVPGIACVILSILGREDWVLSVLFGIPAVGFFLMIWDEKRGRAIVCLTPIWLGIYSIKIAFTSGGTDSGGAVLMGLFLIVWGATQVLKAAA